MRSRTDRQPMNPHVQKQSFFDGIVPQWILDTDERSVRLAEIFASYDLPVAAPVLDVGGGAGILLPFLRKRLDSGTDASPIIELEMSTEMLRMARRMHGTGSRVAYIRGDAHRLPFPEHYFGCIHCFSVFPHFDHPRRALAEFQRCLRPGGGLCILHLMGHRQLNAIHRGAGRIVADDHLPPVEHLAGIVAGAGFDVRYTEERSDLYLLIAQSSSAASPPRSPR